MAGTWFRLKKWEKKLGQNFRISAENPFLLWDSNFYQRDVCSPRRYATFCFRVMAVFVRGPVRQGKNSFPTHRQPVTALALSARGPFGWINYWTFACMLVGRGRECFWGAGVSHCPTLTPHTIQICPLYPLPVPSFILKPPTYFVSRDKTSPQAKRHKSSLLSTIITSITR